MIDDTIQGVGVWRNFELYAFYNEPKLTALMKTASLLWVDLVQCAEE